jgi:AraC-like DNA-binding protein
VAFSGSASAFSAERTVATVFLRGVVPACQSFVTLGQAQHTLPASHALALVELVKRWKVDQSELLEGSGLSDATLSAPEARVPLSLVIQLIERARALTGEPGLGYYLGLQTRVSAHGYLGFAAMTSATLREALELAIRFTPTRTTAIALRLHEDGDTASVIIDECADFGAARDVLVASLMIGLWQIGNSLTGRELDGTADFAYPEPAYFGRFAHFVPGVRFAQPVNQLIFAREHLELKVKMADPSAQRLALEQCERAMQALGYGGKITDRVRALIASTDSLEDVARALGVSVRTLKRKLAQEGMAYSTLLAEEQRDAALLLLRAGDRSIEQIADHLGYSDVANFTRAFRRWTGMTPGAYRRSLR